MPKTIARIGVPSALPAPLFPALAAAPRDSLNINHVSTVPSPLICSAPYLTAPSCPSDRSQRPVLSPVEGPMLASASGG